MTPTKRWATIAVAAAVTTAAVYLLAVWTKAGQQLENAALRGTDESYNNQTLTADDALAEITVYSLAAACLLIVVIGLFRRRLEAERS